MKVALGLLGMESLAGGDYTALRDVVAIADRKGIDQVTVFDHVVMGETFEEYPQQPFTGNPKTPFLEPMVELGGYAAVTKDITLSSSIVIAPLRPAALLAKQIATLDVLSRGRMEIGLGVGWQSAEYAACGVDYASRFEILEEQIRVCRALWSGEKTSFNGKYIQLDQVTSMPTPVQGTRVPIWLGVALKRRNVERIAELCDGWCPMERDPARLKAGVETLKRAFEKHGRDPEELQVRNNLAVQRGSDGKPDLEATLATIGDYAAAGVTMVRIEARRFCRRLEDVESLFERIVQIKG